MGRKFFREIENPERNIEKEVNVSNTPVINKSEEYTDDFDEILNKYETKEKQEKGGELLDKVKKQNSNSNSFMERIKVTQLVEETPFIKASRELYEARQSRDKERIINAENVMLDVEKQMEDKEFNERIAKWKESRNIAREEHNEAELKSLSAERKQLVLEMKLSDLRYKISKLQNSQKLSPSKERLQEIVELNKELRELEDSTICR